MIDNLSGAPLNDASDRLFIWGRGQQASGDGFYSKLYFGKLCSAGPKKELHPWLGISSSSNFCVSAEKNECKKVLDF